LKAVVDTALEGQSEAVTSYAARFAGAVFPGETITTRIWQEDDGFLLNAVVEKRAVSVLSNSRITAG
jgi:acyl dehydratase